jgi:hypothetical protein
MEMVTEKMLKNHFQGFVDSKISLASTPVLPPVFDQPPQIDPDGLLTLHGHFDLPDYKLLFDLAYAYELPRWKLFAINMAVVK